MALSPVFTITPVVTNPLTGAHTSTLTGNGVAATVIKVGKAGLGSPVVSVPSSQVFATGSGSAARGGDGASMGDIVKAVNATNDRLDKVEKAQLEPAAKLAKLSEAVDKLRAAPAAAMVQQAQIDHRLAARGDV